jgi:hypothetical protein
MFTAEQQIGLLLVFAATNVSFLIVNSGMINIHYVLASSVER